MKKIGPIIILAAVLIGLYIYFNPQNGNLSNTITFSKLENNKSQNQTTDRISIVAQNLEVPWALAFLPSGEMLVTERPGRVRFIDKNGNLDKNPIFEIEVVKKIQGEGGLHGIAVHPDFGKNRFVYLYYTYENQGKSSLNRVVRYIFKENVLTLDKIIVDKIPGALFHDGGRIKFGPDSLLYITTGDAQNPSLSQDKSSLAGKILRVKDDGATPSDNPFNNLVYSYGHRNPQGLAWNGNELYASEHGSSTLDEVNKINKGLNYGWPEIRGDNARQGMEKPIVHSGSDTWAPSGAAFLGNRLFFGGLRGQALFELDTNSLNLKAHFKGELGRIRDVVLGPDNMLYITTSNRDGRGFPIDVDDRVIKINPQKL